MRLAATLIASLALAAASSPLADATDAPATSAAPAAALQPAPVPPPPAITAKSYVLIDALSRQVLAGQNETARVDPASLTKLMTSYAVFGALRDGKLRLDQEVPVSEHAWRAGGAAPSAERGRPNVPSSERRKGRPRRHEQRLGGHFGRSNGLGRNGRVAIGQNVPGQHRGERRPSPPPGEP